MKIIFRSLLLLLSVAMVLTAFAGCEKNIYDLPLKNETPLEEAVAIQIADDFNAYMRQASPHSNVTYRVASCYGIFDGYVVLDFEGGEGFPPRDDTVAAKVFYIGNGKDLWVWKDGEIRSLLQAYQEGVLTAEDVATVHKARNNGNIQTDAEGNLTMDFMYALVEDYANQDRLAHPFADGQHPSSFKVPRTYGLYNGCVVVGDLYILTYLPVIEDSGERVKIPPLKVWREGTFYSLQDAYDRGWITNRNLRAIRNLYYG